MSTNAKALKVRIRSVDSTLHLTKAMGLVASSKMRGANRRRLDAEAYGQAWMRAITVLSGSVEARRSIWFDQGRGDRARLVVIAGDRGLAGGYNANIFRLADAQKSAETFAIGKRAADRYGGERLSVESFSAEQAREIAASLVADYREGKYDRLGIVYTKYRSMLVQEACLQWILPLTPPDDTQNLPDVVFEPDAEGVLSAALPGYLTAALMLAARESFASEVAARRAAMDSAGRNAERMIQDMRLQYNRERQGGITQEITEIVAGSNR